MQRPGRELIAPASVVACCVVTPLVWWLPLLGPLRGGGRVVFAAFDQYQYSLPHWYYMAWMLGHGALSLWDPYQLSGTPYLAVQNHGMLYPPNWLMLVVGVPEAIRSLMLAHYMLAMGGAYWCARVFGAARVPALLAGVVYAFSGSVAGTGAGCTPPILASVCWLPALLALTRTLLVAQARWSLVAVGLAAAMALSFLGGHPQQTLMSLQLCAFYAVAHVLGVAWRRGPAAAAALLPRLMLAGTFAAGLAAIQLIPTGELMLRSPRRPGALGLVGGSNPLPGSFAWTVALRNALYPVYRPGSVGDGRVGLATIALLPASLFWPGRRAPVLFLWLAAVVILLIALGEQTPVFGWYLHLPGAAWFRVPGRIMFVDTLCVAALAAIGLDALRRRRRAAEVGLALALGLACLLVLYALLPHTPTTFALEVAARSRFTRGIVGFALWGALLVLAKTRRSQVLETGCIVAVIAATAIELYASMSIPPPVPATQPEALRVPWAAAAFIRERQGLARTFAPNLPRQWPPVETTDIPPKLGLLTGLWVVADYENLFDARYARFLGYLTSSTPEPMATYLAQVNVRSVEPRQLPLLRLLGVGFVLVRRDAQIAVPLPVIYRDDEYLVYELPNPAARAYVASQVRAAIDPESVLAGMLSDPGWVLNGGAFVEHTGAEALGTIGSVEVVRYTAHAVDLRVQLAHDGLVVINDEYDPFWVATVDGGAAEVWRANYIFRGVRVSAGDHVVRLTYRPTLVYGGAAISLMSFAGALAAVIIGTRRLQK